MPSEQAGRSEKVDTLIAAREMRALVWTDVDLEKGQLRIERARQHNQMRAASVRGDAPV